MHYPPELFAAAAGGNAAPSVDSAKPGGVPAQSLGAPPAAAAPDGRYTTNPAEAARVNTQPSPQALLALVKTHFPGISDDAALTLLSQSSFECGGWKACWNNNLGNAKEPNASKPHF